MFSSGVARAFLGGRVAHPEDQNEEENSEKLRKNERKYRKKRKIEEMFLSCPPESVRLATALVFRHQKWRQMHYHANALIKWHFGYESNVRCNDWIPKSNPFRRFPHKKVARFLHKNYKKLKIIISLQILPILPIKNPWVSINFQNIAKKCEKTT